MEKEQINEVIDKLLYQPNEKIEIFIKDKNIEELFKERLEDLKTTEEPKDLKIFEDIYKTDCKDIAMVIAENRQTPDYILEHYSNLENLSFEGKEDVQREAIYNKKEKDREMDFFPM